jgi:hypothetical protein
VGHVDVHRGELLERFALSVEDGVLAGVAVEVAAEERGRVPADHLAFLRLGELASGLAGAVGDAGAGLRVAAGIGVVRPTDLPAAG